MKTTGQYRPTSQAVVSDPGGGGGAVASLLANPAEILTENNFGASNNTGLSPGQRSWGVDVSNFTLISGTALPTTAHVMTMTITLRAQHSFEGGSTAHAFNIRYKNPDGSWSTNRSQAVNVNVGYANYDIVSAINVDGLFTPAYVLGPTFVVEAWISCGSPDGMAAGVMLMDVVKVKFDYVDDYNTDVVLLPYFVDNARGASEPLWSNPTFALVQDSSGANVQLYQSTINLTAWLWAMYAAIPNLTSLSHMEIQHRVRYQNVTNPGTAVGGIGGPRAQWTWLWANGWGLSTGGPTPPVPIYTQQGQVSGPSNQTWPFAIDVWGDYAQIVTDADLTWVGTALKDGKFGQGLVYTFNTTYSSQRLNFYVDVARIRIRYMASAGAAGGSLLFRMSP